MTPLNQQTDKLTLLLLWNIDMSKSKNVNMQNLINPPVFAESYQDTQVKDKQYRISTQGYPWETFRVSLEYMWQQLMLKHLFRHTCMQRDEYHQGLWKPMNKLELHHRTCIWSSTITYRMGLHSRHIIDLGGFLVTWVNGLVISHHRQRKSPL